MNKEAEICDMINSPIVVFRGCTLPEIFKIARMIFLLLLSVFVGLSVLLFGFGS